MDTSTILKKISDPFVKLAERHYPDPFIFLIILTALAFILALTITDTNLVEATIAWGNGLSGLLSFMTQICLTLIAGHALAHTNLIQKILHRAAQIPQSENQCYAWAAFISGICTFISWALGLVAGGLIARHLAQVGHERNWKLHYPLIVASAYSGFIVWHMGYSGSAPLFVATDGHSLQNLIGIIPVSDTIFSNWNLLTATVIILIVSLICSKMTPEKSKCQILNLNETEQHQEISDTYNLSLFNRLNNYHPLNIFLGTAVFFYIFLWFNYEKLSLNLNIVNWSFLAAGLLLANSPTHYARLISNAVHTTSPILLQFPFYAAVMGLMTETGLVSIISNGFTTIATQETLPILSFLSAGLINLFIPSGGAQWIVQGPIFLEAAANLGADPSIIVMSIAYGDQWTNMVQPFWAMPLLAIAGMQIRDIMGYTFIIFLVGFFVFGASVLFAPHLIQ